MIMTLGGYWPPLSKVEIAEVGGGTNELFFVTFFLLLFLLRTWNQNFFSLTRGKILQCSPYHCRQLGGTQTKTLPLPPIEAQSIDMTISPNKLAMITRRKCGRRGDELTMRATKLTSNNGDRQHDGNAATLPAMDGTVATVMDGATATWRQR